MSEEIKKIITLGDIFKNIETEEKAFKFKDYIKHLQQKVEQLEKEIDKLNKEYERIYNENCKLRENHNINDIILLDENERLNNIIEELKWKSIEEYDKSNYDWVLVKYFDGDYECVPCVAEKRFGKWYSIDEKEIQFDVKYFMDMQQLDKLKALKENNNE